MKRWVKVLLIAILVIVILAAGAFLVLKYISDKSVTDKGGMENPFADSKPEALDGDYTYADNDALLAVIAGTWKSGDGHWELRLDSDCRAVFALDGETVLDGEITFTYLQPGEVSYTDFTLAPSVFAHADGTSFAEAESLHHEAGDGSGKIILEAVYPDGSAVTVEFTKTTD